MPPKQDPIRSIQHVLVEEEEEEEEDSLFSPIRTTIHIKTNSKQTKLAQWSGASKNMRYRLRCSLIQSVNKKHGLLNF